MRNKTGAEAIQHIGIKALPTALKLCHANDSKFQSRLVRLSEDLSDPPHFDIHLRDDDQKHLEGIAIFSALGSAAKTAIPSLIEILQGNNPLFFATAMLGLHGIGSDSVPPLVEVLTNGNRQGRINVATCLGYYFGRQASNAVPILLQYLGSEDLGLRRVAAESLPKISHDSIEVVPALAKYLETETNRNSGRFEIIFWLGYMGTNARPAIPVLIKLAKSDPRTPAYHALYQIAPEIAKPIFEKWKASQTNETTDVKQF